MSQNALCTQMYAQQVLHQALESGVLSLPGMPLQSMRANQPQQQQMLQQQPTMTMSKTAMAILAGAGKNAGAAAGTSSAGAASVSLSASSTAVPAPVPPAATQPASAAPLAQSEKPLGSRRESI